MSLSGFWKFDNYPKQILANNSNGIVIALDEKKVAKFRHDNSFEQLVKESKRMHFANQVNDLMVSFHEVSKDSYNNNMLIMERIYPLQYRALDVKTRFEYCELFELKLRELHNAGFVFGDLNSTIQLSGYANYMLTHQGIRLIDSGISILREEVSESTFEECVKSEISEIRLIKRIILDNEIPAWAQT